MQRSWLWSVSGAVRPSGRAFLGLDLASVRLCTSERAVRQDSGWGAEGHSVVADGDGPHSKIRTSSEDPWKA